MTIKPHERARVFDGLCLRYARPLILLLLTLPAIVNAQTGGTFSKRVFSGITAPATSAVLPNQGQGLHLLTVMFPAASGAVTGISVRIEASYDNVLFVPITLDITETIYTGAFAYAQTRGNGAFPYVRVRVVTASVANPMTVYYTGGMQPIGNLYLSTDRFLASSGSGYDRATFAICTGTPCSVSVNLTNRYVVVFASTVETCWITAKSAPTGQALIVDLLQNGTTSIFGATKLTLNVASTGPQQFTSSFAVPRLNAGDFLTINVTQIGTITPGQDVTATCKLIQ